MLELDELLDGFHFGGFRSEVRDQLVDLRFHVAWRGDDQVVGQLIGGDDGAQAIRPPPHQLGEVSLQLRRQIAYIQTGQLDRPHIHRRLGLLLDRRVVLLEQRQALLGRQLGCVNEDAVGAHVSGHFDLAYYRRAHLLRHQAGDLAL